MKNVDPIPSARRNARLVLLSLLKRDDLEAISVQYKVDGVMYNDCCDYLTAEDLAFIIAILQNQMWHLLNDDEEED